MRLIKLETPCLSYDECATRVPRSGATAGVTVHMTQAMRLVVDIQKYTNRAVRDCIERGESPYSTHLTLQGSGALEYETATEALLGINAGFAWLRVADGLVFYLDHGMTEPMAAAWRFALKHRPDLPTEFRFLVPPFTSAEQLTRRHFPWEAGFGEQAAYHAICDLPAGRLEAVRLGRAHQRGTFEVRLRGHLVAVYGSMAAARGAAEHFYAWLERDGLPSGVTWPA